jgi:hypothetical protein
MRSFLRSTVLVASTLVACWGIPGCLTETANATGKMGGAMDNIDTRKMEMGKMGGAMDNIDTRKTGSAMDRMETGKMGGAMDKMEKGKME